MGNPLRWEIASNLYKRIRSKKKRIAKKINRPWRKIKSSQKHFLRTTSLFGEKIEKRLWPLPPILQEVDSIYIHSGKCFARNYKYLRSIIYLEIEKK